jgi:tetraacyldisaccharide 4'-kinase
MMNFRRLLFPFSWLYILVTDIRNVLYDKRIFKSASFDIPVIAVGNLRVGGEGKTPHIEYLVQLLQPAKKVAILSRGYQRKTRGYAEVKINSTPEQCGDEPVQFKNKFPETFVAVDEQRALGIAHILMDAEDTEVILLDDAFQHRSVKAGLYILLTSYGRLYTRDAVLPAGNLRERKKGAERAQVIIVSKCPHKLSETEQQEIIRELNPLPHQQVFFTSIGYDRMRPLFASSHDTNAENILLVTGIANPQPLLEYCKTRFTAVKHMRFADHHAFTDNDITRIIAEMHTLPQGSILLTTEKDAMRLKEKTALQNLPVYFLPIKTEFLAQEDTFRKTILNYVNTNT